MTHAYKPEKTNMAYTFNTQKTYFKAIALIFLLTFIGHVYGDPHKSDYVGIWQTTQQGWIKTMFIYHQDNKLEIISKLEKPKPNQKDWYKESAGTYRFPESHKHEQDIIIFHYTHVGTNVPNFDLEPVKQQVLNKDHKKHALFNHNGTQLILQSNGSTEVYTKQIIKKS